LRKSRSPLLLLFPAFGLFSSLPPICSAQQPPPPQAQKGPPTQVAPAPAAPQSTHYPILLLAHGSEPSWSVLIGQKGPERLERANYPPVLLESVEVIRDASSVAWTYRAKDLGTGAAVAVQLAREPCSETASTTLPSAGAVAQKYTFRAVVEHAQIGTLHGCARIAAELFPHVTNQTDDDDPAKKKPPTSPVTNFKAPVAVAFLNSTGKVVLSRGAGKKIAAPAGSELSLSHDGRKLLYTRADSNGGPDRTLVLYDSDTGRSKDLVYGALRQPFWSPDDSRVAFLKLQDQKWQIWSFRGDSLRADSPEYPAPFYDGDVNALHGWADANTVLATDKQNAYWISDGKPQQSLPLKDLYGDAFQISVGDTLRVNPTNPDLLLVSAKFAAPSPSVSSDPTAQPAGFFLFELRSKRRVTLSPSDQWVRSAEWSRDGVQIFYTRRVTANSFATFRILWDATSVRRYQDGSDLVVGQ